MATVANGYSILAENRLLELFNRARTARDIHKAYVPGEEIACETLITNSTARQIVEFKSQLPNGRIERLSQLSLIADINQQEIELMMDRFAVSGAVRFKNYMIQHGLGAQWEFNHYSTVFPSMDEFLQVVNHQDILKEFVAKEVKRISLEKHKDERKASLVGALIPSCYIEKYEMGHIASYAWALWFYRFDADNYFSFHSVEREIEKYLGSACSEADRKELYMFKGFDNALAFHTEHTVTDLPVVVDFEDLSISLWTCQLMD